MAYAGFYFCRKNLSVVMPLLEQDLHYSKIELANVIFGFSLCYAVGQFCSGMLSDRFGPRLIVSVGLFVSVVANVLMGFSPSLSVLIGLACLNGAGQSAGWPGLVKNMACWFGRRERGVVMAWWSTNYVLGGFLATVAATAAVTLPGAFPKLGWRRGFWAPALVLFLVGLCFASLARNTPADARLPAMDDPAEDGEASGAPVSVAPQTSGSSAPSGPIRSRLLSNRAVWVIALMYFFLKLTRYAFLFWLPLYMTERLGYSVGEAGYASSLYELVGFLGAILAGYASDKLMQSRRFPVGAVMLWGLALVSLIQPLVATRGHWQNDLGIGLIGIMTYGPDTLMSGAAAMDTGSARQAATAAGIINGVGSVGQLLSPYVVACVAGRYGWDPLFHLFVVFALIGGTLLATKWNYNVHAAQAERT